LQGELARAGILSRRAASPGECDETVSYETRALAIVPPIQDQSVAHYCASFREAHHHVPVLVVTPGTLHAPGVRALYRKGVQAVLEWPRDRQALLRTAFRLVGTSAGNTEPNGGADVGLEELVNERLRNAASDFRSDLVARVRTGFAALSGEVDALWKVYVAEQVVQEVPGIVEVNVNAVAVSGPARSDGAIANAIRQVLEQSSVVDSSTLALRVDNGHVVIAGSTSDRKELERALDLVERVHGVRSIDNYATVSDTAKQQDQRVAERVRTAVRAHYPKSKVDVAVFGGIGVLSGVVESAARRCALQKLVDGQEGVNRVVDKLRVRPAEVRPRGVL
jgi:osmotically-inducible protein OsmY